jgi:hypothetical protein
VMLSILLSFPPLVEVRATALSGIAVLRARQSALIRTPADICTHHIRWYN